MHVALTRCNIVYTSVKPVELKMSILLVKIRISDLVIYMFRNVIFVLIMLNKIKIL